MSKSKAKKKNNKKVMKKEVTINESQVKSLNKYYTIAKILLAVSPFISLMYLSAESARVGLSLIHI